MRNIYAIILELSDVSLVMRIDLVFWYCPVEQSRDTDF
jgi:hypothetical protein